MNTETIVFNPISGCYELHTCRCLIPYDHLSNGVCGRQGCGGRIPPVSYVVARAANFDGIGVDPAKGRRTAEWLTDGERGRPVDPWPTPPETPTDGEWDAWKTPGQSTFTVGWMVDIGAEGFQRVAIVETVQAAEALVALLKVFGAVPER